MKRIKSIQTWAGMSVALCDDGTLWEARPVWDYGNIPYAAPRLVKMNWNRIADGGDIKEDGVLDDLKAAAVGWSEKYAAKVRDKEKSCPGPIQGVTQMEGSGLFNKMPKESDAKLWSQGDIRRDVNTRATTLSEMEYPEWLMAIQKNCDLFGLSPVREDRPLGEARLNIVTLLGTLQEAVLKLREIAHAGEPCPAGYPQNMARDFLSHLGFKKI